MLPMMFSTSFVTGFNLIPLPSKLLSLLNYTCLWKEGKKSIYTHN